MQRASIWFDELSNLQATAFLMILMVGMLGAAGCLLLAAVVLVRTPSQAQLAPVAVSVPAAQSAPAQSETAAQSAPAAQSETATAPSALIAPSAPAAAERAVAATSPQPERDEPVLTRASVLLSTANLRAEPTASSRSLAVLPARTDLVLLGETAQTGTTLWEHVRTQDAREGWVIATALD